VSTEVLVCMLRSALLFRQVADTGRHVWVGRLGFVSCTCHFGCNCQLCLVTEALFCADACVLRMMVNQVSGTDSLLNPPKV
jgi:hypothetical protein